MDWILFYNIFLKHSEIFFEFIDIIDSAVFKNIIYENIFQLIKKYNNKYKKIPDIDTLIMLLDNIDAIEMVSKKEYIDILTKIEKLETKVDIDAFKEQLLQVIRKYEMEKFILESANSIEKITFDDMMGNLREIIIKYKPKSLGVVVTQAERGVKFIKHDIVEKVSTGIDSLDKILYGGYGTNELAVIMAPPGRGKSFFLLNAMYGAMLTQHDVLYITLELSEKSIIKRLYGRISYSTRKEMLEEAILIRAINKYFTLCKAKGRVAYFSSRSISVGGLETFLEQQYLYFGFQPGLIVLDYLDLLSPRNTDYRLDTRHRLRGITDDLRSITLRRNIPILTASQTNRESLIRKKITEANVSESFGKIEVADVVLALCQTDEEKKMKRARLVVLKNRDYISGSCIEVYVDFDRMLLLDLGVAEKMGLLGGKKEDE